ncbi:hypothetical protein BP6252_07521 [Coleophoma cylindrospora]|uniref:DUF1365-domain-containing protein n=1 Tax=Coleophoma cylindrospora TaxID=1849047 RepID=A0A3D8RAL8_9HELO|nr:hypothetical protein BP6252_07521 [Coleophoma cylindrospora]
MNIFTTSATLVLSGILRSVLVGDTILLLADSAVIVILIQWMPSFWTTIAVTTTTFLGMAFYETRAEYLNMEGNVREAKSERLVESKSSSSNPNLGAPHMLLSPSDSATGICPVASFNPLKLSRKASVSLPLVTDNHSRKDFSKGTEPQDKPTLLHGNPIVFPCELRHRRINPFKDQFRHSYLYCGVPVGLHACYSPIICVDLPRDPRSRWPFRRAWFNIRAQDYGIRGGSSMTLAQKLREYLLSEGADPNEWEYAYLLTVPSTNGQLDNPLGFWYLYSAKRELTAIVPELNTSYGERRMWLVRQTLSAKTLSEKRTTSLYSFRGHFGKDIHVSPFMPSTGGYTIDTCDPCASPLNRLDILVTLTKEEGGPLLVTRVTSSEPGLNASTSSIWEKALFLIRWWYVPMATVMTYRILSQAARIYLKAPRYWTRPEPGKTALGKPARAVERTLERSFRLILKSIVESHPAPISVTYLTPGEHSNKSEVFNSLVMSNASLGQLPTSNGSTTLSASEGPLRVDLQIISPIFYSRFFHYRSPLDAFTSELLDDDRTRTLWSSDPILFMSIFNTAGMNASASTEVFYPSGSKRWHWWLLSFLRKAPIATNYPRKIAYESFDGLSSMDIWMLEHRSPREVKDYRRAILRIFIGEWIGGTVWPLNQFSDDLEPFGLSRDAVLRLYDVSIRVAIATGMVEIFRGLTGCNVWIMGAAEWMLAGVNLWACLKSSL